MRTCWINLRKYFWKYCEISFFHTSFFGFKHKFLFSIELKLMMKNKKVFVELQKKKFIGAQKYKIAGDCDFSWTLLKRFDTFLRFFKIIVSYNLDFFWKNCNFVIFVIFYNGFFEFWIKSPFQKLRQFKLWISQSI